MKQAKTLKAVAWFFARLLVLNWLEYALRDSEEPDATIPELEGKAQGSLTMRAYKCEPIIVDGSKANAMLTYACDNAHSYSDLEVDWQAVLHDAQKRCERWGFDEAEALGTVQSTCKNPRRYGGCSMWRHEAKIACLD